MDSNSIRALGRAGVAQLTLCDVSTGSGRCKRYATCRIGVRAYCADHSEMLRMRVKLAHNEDLGRSPGDGI